MSIATGTNIAHISGQTEVDTAGKVVGSTHLDQSIVAWRNLKMALGAAGATMADVAKITICVVDYSWARLRR